MGRWMGIYFEDPPKSAAYPLPDERAPPALNFVRFFLLLNKF